MPNGLEVYGPTGILWVGVDDYTGKVKGIATYTPPVNSGTSDVAVSAPGAGSLNDPFVVFLNIAPENLGQHYQQSGNGVQNIECFSFSSANVVAGQDTINVQRTWSFNGNASVPLLYGEL